MASDTIRYTSCGYHCLSQCILKVRVRDGAIVAIEPDDTVNPGVPREDVDPTWLDRGMMQTRPCAKGYAQAQMLRDPRRVIYPLKRLGKRGDGQFERISWDEAIDTIAAKLIETKTTYGPYSIIHHPYSNFSQCSLPVAPWFGAGIAGWDSHSSNGWMEPQRWVLGREYEKGVVRDSGLDLGQDEANVFQSKLIVLWGLNPLMTFNGGFGYNLLRAKERGIPIIAIEGRYTPSVEVLADQWIPIRPSTDVAMMIAMANVWFREGLCDDEFIQKHVEPDGLARWKAYVLGNDGTEKTPEWAEQVCGVPAETIRDFARLYARSSPVNLNVAFSIGRQFYGENPVRASMYLQALTGNLCKPGATAAAETGLFRGKLRLPLPKVDWQRASGTYSAPVLIMGYKWLKAIDLREKLDKGEVSTEAYNAAIGNLPDNPLPNIKMAILDSNNHPSSLPDINANIRALMKLDFYVVASYYTDSTAARYADIILPQNCTAFEGRHCLSPITPGDMFRPGYHLANYFIYRQKCVEAPGEVKTTDWYWLQIAKRLGLAEQYSPRLAGIPDEVWDDTIESFHQEAYEQWAAKPEVIPLDPPPWEEFFKKPVFRWEIKQPNFPYKADVEAGLNPFRQTPSGKVELYAEKLANGPEYLRTNEYYPKKCYGGGRLPPMAEMTEGGRDSFYGDDTAKYPLLMSSPHSYYRVHSFLDNDPWLEECYRHAIWISVADARLRSIKDNDKVRVFNDIGEIVMPAFVTSRTVPGSVYVFHGAWYRPGEKKTELMPEGIDERGAPNILIHNEDLPWTPLGFLPCKGLVQVQKWEA